MKTKFVIYHHLSLVILLMSALSIGQAATITSSASGYYSSPSTWAGGAVPSNGDNIIILSGHTVTMDAPVFLMSITINAGATLDNDTYPVTIDNITVGNPVYTNNGTHNGTGKLISYDDYVLTLDGSGITNCDIEIRSYGLVVLNTCNLTINGNIAHAIPGNNGMNNKDFISVWQGGALTVNGDLLTDEQYMVGLAIGPGGLLFVSGDVMLNGGLSSGSGSNITNNGTFQIGGNLSIGPWMGYCVNSGAMTVGGNILGGGATETYFLQEIYSTLTVGGAIFPDTSDGILLASGISLITSMPVEPNTIEYNGSDDQVIKLPYDNSPYSILKINNTGNSGVHLMTDVNINGSLFLNEGRLHLGDYNLWLSDSATISGFPSSSGMVIATGPGELRKSFSTPGTFTFPIGDTNGIADYTPLTLTFQSGSFTSAWVGVTTVNEAYPGVSGNYLNRYWTLTSSGISNFECDATFNYVPNDVVGDENTLYCYRVAPTTNQFDPANSTTHELTANSLTDLGTFTGRQPDTSPLPIAYEVTGGGIYCEGDAGLSVGLTDSEVGVDYTLYRDGIVQGSPVSGTGTAISFGDQTSGLYTVSGENAFGITPMIGEALIVEQPFVTPDVFITTDTNVVCQGSQLTFVAMTDGGGDSPNYQWRVNAVEEGPNMPEFVWTPMDGDVIDLVFTSSFSCTLVNPVYSNSITITVNELPEVTWAAFEPDTLCVNDWEPVELTGGIPAGGIYYGDGVSNGFFDPATAGIGSHLITYVYTDTNGCHNEATLTLFVDLCQTIVENEMPMIVYPNPMNDYVMISTGDQLYIRELIISTITGDVVYRKTVTDNEQQMIVETGEFPAGSYMLRAITPDGRVMTRMLIK